MGRRVNITLTKDTSHVGVTNSDIAGVHGVACVAGDYSTLCGMQFVDGLTEKETTKAITCAQCISTLNETIAYKKRNGKWF